MIKWGGVTLIDFVDLSLQEKEMILNWRNHKDIKRWIYSQEDFILENHLNFINSLKNKQDRQYLMIKKDDRYIGVIYFTNIDFYKKVCDFGLYANPFEKIVGVGRILEEICIKYVFDILKLKKLKLEVFSDNERAINLYRKFNFKEVDKKVINGKDVICMELKSKGKK